MSFEGYVQAICETGHYFEHDAYCDDGDRKCHCGVKSAWTNLVDDTNCDAFGEIAFSVLEEKLQIEPERVEKCSLGHMHCVAEAIFRIPSEEEVVMMRTSSHLAAMDKMGQR